MTPSSSGTSDCQEIAVQMAVVYLWCGVERRFLRIFDWDSTEDRSLRATWWQVVTIGRDRPNQLLQPGHSPTCLPGQLDGCVPSVEMRMQHTRSTCYQRPNAFSGSCRRLLFQGAGRFS
jgi:hypothetical protein